MALVANLLYAGRGASLIGSAQRQFESIRPSLHTVLLERNSSQRQSFRKKVRPVQRSI